MKSNLPSDVLSVDKVAKNPLAFKGIVKIRGVVSKVFSKRGAFILIDTDEYKGCGLDCDDQPEQSIPVKVTKEKYKGKLPKLKDTVIVTGRILPQGKGYRFIIKDVKRGKEILIKKKTSKSIRSRFYGQNKI